MNNNFWHPTEKEPVTKLSQILTVEMCHTLLNKEAGAFKNNPFLNHKAIGTSEC